MGAGPGAGWDWSPLPPLPAPTMLTVPGPRGYAPRLCSQFAMHLVVVEVREETPQEAAAGAMDGVPGPGF